MIKGFSCSCFCAAMRLSHGIPLGDGGPAPPPPKPPVPRGDWTGDCPLGGDLAEGDEAVAREDFLGRPLGLRARFGEAKPRKKKEEPWRWSWWLLWRRWSSLSECWLSWWLSSARQWQQMAS
jgi:hypothetical protein